MAHYVQFSVLVVHMESERIADDSELGTGGEN